VRIGGFRRRGRPGRASGTEDIDLLVDATHPFAARISANAAEARAGGEGAAAGAAPTRLGAREGDRWTEVDTVRKPSPRWERARAACWSRSAGRNWRRFARIRIISI
jgi:precorrin-6x reductase